MSTHLKICAEAKATIQSTGFEIDLHEEFPLNPASGKDAADILSSNDPVEAYSQWVKNYVQTSGFDYHGYHMNELKSWIDKHETRGYSIRFFIG